MTTCLMAEAPGQASVLQQLPRTQPLRSPSPSNAIHLSIVSYNILADCYVRVPGQPWNAFEHCSDAELLQANRLPRIQENLSISQADVICLQEVEFEKRITSDDAGAQATWCLPAWTDALIAQGYAGVMQGLKQKEWDQNAKRNERMVGRPVPTGVATFYKTSLWEEFQPGRHGSGSGTVLYLRSRQDGTVKFALNNVHLTGSPSKFESQLLQLEGGLKNLLNSEDGLQLPRLIVGDFNNDCQTGSQVHSWMCTNGFQGLPLGGCTWAGPGTGLHVDQLLYTPARLRPLAAYLPLAEEDVCSGTPNANEPSDHVLVGGIFEFV